MLVEGLAEVDVTGVQQDLQAQLEGARGRENIVSQLTGKGRQRKEPISEVGSLLVNLGEGVEQGNIVTSQHQVDDIGHLHAEQGGVLEL